MRMRRISLGAKRSLEESPFPRDDDIDKDADDGKESQRGFRENGVADSCAGENKPCLMPAPAGDEAHEGYQE